MWPSSRARPEIAGRPTIIALPVPQPYGDYGKIIDWRIDESLPGAVGAFIDWLINESGWTVEEEQRRVPIRPRHIAILFRRFRNFGPTLRDRMSVRSKRGASRTSWSEAARSMIAKRSSRCATPSPRSSGLMTSSGSLPRCAAPSSPSATKRCSRSDNIQW